MPPFIWLQRLRCDVNVYIWCRHAIRSRVTCQVFREGRPVPGLGRVKRTLPPVATGRCIRGDIRIDPHPSRGIGRHTLLGAPFVKTRSVIGFVASVSDLRVHRP